LVFRQNKPAGEEEFVGMTKEISVLLVEPGQNPHDMTICNTLEAFEERLGGPVEIGCYLPPRVLLIYREDGKQRGLPPNRWNPATNERIFGTFLLCGLEEDAFESLTPAQRATFQRYFAQSDSPPHAPT